MSLETLCDKLVFVHPKSVSRGTAGSVVVTHATNPTASYRARIQPASSNEIMWASQRGYEITHVLYFHQSPGVSNGDQVRFEGRIFDVRSEPINFDEQDRLWKIFADEREQEQ
jgi:SPP1 family predicted phage head-tail adaptor